MKRLAALLLLVACTPPCPPLVEPQIVIVDMADAGDLEDGPAALWDDCAHACAVVRRLGCSEGGRVDGGESCTTVCRHARDSRLTDLHQGCVAHAHSRADVHACSAQWCLP